MADPFHSPRLRLASANKGIRDLHIAFEAYVHSNPYAKAIEHDAKAGLDIHKIKLTKQLDEQLSVDVITVAENLRSALDQTGFAMALAGGAPIIATSTYFPFANSAAKLDQVIKGRCQNVPPDIVAVFRAFQPYKGGDDLLWSINEIANGSKHRMIIPVGHGIGGQFIEHAHFEHVKRMEMPPRWDSANDQVVLFSCLHGAKSHYKMSLAIFIAFGDIEIVRGQPVLGVLHALASKVEGIIAATEAQAKIIGLVP